MEYIEFGYNNEDLIKFLQPRVVDAKYSVILYSNTPCLTTPTILKIIEYVVVKGIKACKFNGGFAFNTEYLKSANNIMFDSYLPLDNEDNIVVDSANKLKLATKILKERIINKHIANGVEFVGNSEIDEQVELSKGVIVFGGNALKGNTYIGENTILKENNVIEDSVIAEDSCISSSTIINSKIEENVFVLPYCYVINSTIRKNCYISSGIRIEKRTVRAGSKLKEN